MATYARLDLRRQLRDRMGMFFIVGLPTFMYLVFGLGSDDPVGSGNVGMYVMISMAAYGAVDRDHQRRRQRGDGAGDGLGPPARPDPDAPAGFVAAKAGGRDDRGGDARRPDLRDRRRHRRPRQLDRLVLAATVVWLGSALFAIYGLAICLVFRGSNAPGIASGMIVVMAFLGNVFTPMGGFMLDLGRLTPLYGYVALARFPLTEGSCRSAVATRCGSRSLTCSRGR